MDARYRICGQSLRESIEAQTYRQNYFKFSLPPSLVEEDHILKHIQRKHLTWLTDASAPQVHFLCLPSPFVFLLYLTSLFLCVYLFLCFSFVLSQSVICLLSKLGAHTIIYNGSQFSFATSQCPTTSSFHYLSKSLEIYFSSFNASESPACDWQRGLWVFIMPSRIAG